MYGPIVHPPLGLMVGYSIILILQTWKALYELQGPLLKAIEMKNRFFCGNQGFLKKKKKNQVLEMDQKKEMHMHIIWLETCLE